MSTKLFLALAAATLATSVVLQPHTAQAQTCPAGRACFYAPPSMPPPTGTWEVGWDMIIASPRGTITGTYTIGTGMPVAFSVSPGMPLRVDLGNAAAFVYAPAVPQNTFNATASTYNRAEQRGIFVDASSAELIIDHRLVRGPWQSSETIKPSASGLGTRFRLSGYSLNQTSNADTGHDYVSLYSPEGATVTLTAPPGAPMPFWGDGVAGAVRTVMLARGQTMVVRTIEGCTGVIDGALVTSTSPIAVSSGGRGWSGGAGSCAVGGGCGDDGADNVIPTTGIGTQYIVDDYPTSGADGERVHVIADVANTVVRVNGVMVATLAAGQTHTFSPNGLTFVETSLPAYVFEESGLSGCETDTALIPPVVFAPIARWVTDFNVSGSGQVSVFIPTTGVASLRLDNLAVPMPTVTAVPGHPEWTRVRFAVTGGNHSVTATADFQLGLVSATGGTGLFAYYTPFRIPGCGDGILGATEGCDDSNVNDGDGCSSSCLIEVGSMGCTAVRNCVPVGVCDMGTCRARCLIDANCNDSNECTVDSCGVGGLCSNIGRPRGTMCTGGLCSAPPMSVCRPSASDADADGVPNDLDADDDNDGIPDAVEGDGDPDMDGIPNRLDLDSDGDGVFDIIESGSRARDMNNDGRVDNPVDGDDDGLASVFDSNDMDRTIITSVVVPPNTDAMLPGGDMVPDYLDVDDDGDGVSTRNELGAGGAQNPRNTDLNLPGGDMIPDYLDNDDDGDGIITRTELGAGGEGNPQNSDAMVPAGQGTSDITPDYLDNDDDGDGIATSVERTLAGMNPDPDMDNLPAWLDRDADGDSVFDVIEAGPNPMVPANSDMDSNRDFLDLDSDNDCVPDRDPREAGAARTNPAVPAMMVNDNCAAPNPVCNVTSGLCSPDGDADMDGIPDMTERRLGTDPNNPDSDMDGIPDGAEVGPGPGFMTRDTDMDGMIDALDPDDDGDGVPTREELGPGGFMMPRNSDAMVPGGEGMSDMLPDYLDPDDDGDGIPTRVERMLENDMPVDMDMVPAYLDRDSDGDGVPDSIERGMDAMNPANSDGMSPGDRPDFLDLDSDNDCLSDGSAREAGGARIDPMMPSMDPNANCSMLPRTPVCDTTRGECVAVEPDAGVSDASIDASADSGPVSDASAADGRTTGDASVGDASMDGAMDVSTGDGGVRGVISGDGTCACRAPSAPTSRSNAPVAALLALGAVLVSRRRKRVLRG